MRTRVCADSYCVPLVLRDRHAINKKVNLCNCLSTLFVIVHRSRLCCSSSLQRIAAAVVAWLNTSIAEFLEGISGLRSC